MKTSDLINSISQAQAAADAVSRKAQNLHADSQYLTNLSAELADLLAPLNRAIVEIRTSELSRDTEALSECKRELRTGTWTALERLRISVVGILPADATEPVQMQTFRVIQRVISMVEAEQGNWL